MKNSGFHIIVGYTLLLLIQHFFISRLSLLGWGLPNITLLSILLLPLNFSKPGSLWLSFFFGLILDTFSNTPGFNALGFTIVAYLRLIYLNNAANIDLIESGTIPDIRNIGYFRFSVYATAMALIYHFSFFSIESFHLKHLPFIVIKTLFSTIATVLFCVLIQMLFFPKLEEK